MTRWLCGVLGLGLALLAMPMADAQDAPAAEAASTTGAAAPAAGELTPPPVVPAPDAAIPQPPPEDKGAQLFMLKCAGCHTVGGGALTGPDLRATQTWPRQNLEPAVLRMEKNVGKIPPEELQLLMDLLLAADASGRIAEEQKNIAQRQLAKLAPANANTGEALFSGRLALENRGLACAACHGVLGHGGTLAKDLTGAFARLGEVPLMSSIEGATFPLMKAAYTGHPVTKQEALHLVKYIEASGQQPALAAASVPLHALGAAGAALLYAGLAFQYRKRNRGVRKALLSKAVRRSRS